MSTESLNPAEWMEPYRIRVVEPLRFTSRAEREAALAEAGYNLYALPARMVLIDLLTDSGTGALSRAQMAAMAQGDESYAGSSSYYRLEQTAREIFGYEHLIPTHQGRAAERLLLGALCKPGDRVPANTLFDTTRANCLDLNVEPCDLPDERFWSYGSQENFKGNMDVAALETLLAWPEGERVPFVLVTITNNLCGDQPVSLENLRAVRRAADRHGKPVFYDACRFAQNAWFIQQFEPGYAGRGIEAIVREMFSLADGCFLSAKKDAMAQIGGFLAVRDAGLAGRIRERLVLGEGYLTYGGMTGRDMESVATGLREGIGQEHLDGRMRMTAFLHDELKRRGVPVCSPAGGHAVYLPVAELAPQLGADEQPGQVLAAALYLEGGVRTTRVMAPHGAERVEFLRLALPNRVYSTRQLEYVAVCMARVAENAAELRGLRQLDAPRLLGGFLAHYTQGSLSEAGAPRA